MDLSEHGDILNEAELNQSLLTLTNILGFCHEHALILYVYLSNDDVESVLTVCGMTWSYSIRNFCVKDSAKSANSTTSLLTVPDTQAFNGECPLLEDLASLVSHELFLNLHQCPPFGLC